MVEVLVAPGQVLPDALLARVALGAAHDVVVRVPGKAPVPHEGGNAVPVSQLVVLVDQPLHEGLWLARHLLLQQLSLRAARGAAAYAAAAGAAKDGAAA